MKRLFTMAGVVSVLVAASAILVLTAGPSQASWAGDRCSPSHYLDSIFQRKTSQSYAAAALHEGYEWGGGCWNNNDRDDTPSAPDSGGEGPDCSGFVFKTWELVYSSGASGGEYWDRMENVHGPYASYDYHSPVSSDPFHAISKSHTTMVYMDAFAKDGHVAMLASKASGSSNSDYVYEAYSDVSGVGLNLRGYRGISGYSGTRREGWTADCYPNCAMPQQPNVVIA
jgi:hypothetical protein